MVAAQRPRVNSAQLVIHYGKSFQVYIFMIVFIKFDHNEKSNSASMSYNSA